MRALTRGERIFLHVLLAGVVALLGIGTAAVKWFSRDLPSMERLEMIEPSLKTRILARDGSVIKEYFEKNRIFLPLADIPEVVRKTFLAVEDRRFYEHSGIDFTRITRAALRDLTHWTRSHGASTITQQLSTDLFLNKKEVTFTRKFKEALLAFQIERTYSKDEILEMYLNQIYFGGGTYGIEAASLRFFGKSVSALGLQQIALLAGLPKNPEGYNPLKRQDRALRRMNIVLDAMESEKVITKAQRDSLKATSLDLVKETSEKEAYGAYFTEYVRQHLEDKFGARSIYSDGLTVYTTLDPTIQKAAEAQMEPFLARLESEVLPKMTRAKYLAEVEAGKNPEPDYLQSAVVAIDPRSGHILAMVGGRDFYESPFNRAVQAPRQPGSAFKPFLYITAIENGWNASDPLVDSPIVVELPNGDVWKPRNYDEKFHGSMSLREALSRSINIISIKLIQFIGPPSVIATAKRMGIKTPIKNVLSIALGTSEVTLLELTSAYGTLAAEGMHAEPMAILKIVDRSGNVLEENREEHDEALDPEVAYLMTDMLTSVVDEVTGTGAAARAYGLDVAVAGKTGTTDEYADAWFVGYTPEIVVGVWTGFNRHMRMGPGMTGARASLPLWTEVMKAAYPTNQGPPFVRPAGIVDELVCEDSGKLATTKCPKVRREIFLSGSEPTRACDVHSVSTYDLLDKEKNFRELDKEASRDRVVPH